MCLKKQYTGVQINEPNIWQAFLRRIQRVIHFASNGSRSEYSTKDYISGADVWEELPPNTLTPFASS